MEARSNSTTRMERFYLKQAVPFVILCIYIILYYIILYMSYSKYKKKMQQLYKHKDTKLQMEEFST